MVQAGDPQLAHAAASVAGEDGGAEDGAATGAQSTEQIPSQADANPPMRLRCPSTCAHCKTQIDPGTDVFPAERNPVTRRREWYHIGCARNMNHGELPLWPVCKHWKQKGECAYEDKCRFRHPLEAQGCEIKQLKQQRRQPGKRAKIRNESRAAVFRRAVEVLQNYFKAPLLRTKEQPEFVFAAPIRVVGSYLLPTLNVLDVASGKGELAFQLINLNGIKCTAIDPRPLEVDKFVLRFRYGMYHRGKVFDSLNTIVPKCYATHQLQIPPHIRMFLEPGMGSGVVLKEAPFGQAQADLQQGLDVVVDEMIRVGMERALSVKWTQKGLTEGGHEEEDVAAEAAIENIAEDLASVCTEVNPGNEGNSATSEESTNPQEKPKGGAPGVPRPYGQSARGRGAAVSEIEYDEALIKDAATARSALWDCSLVVAMHPDQAIEALVDFALCSGKLFAAVPCCVYAAEFPKRKLPNGDRVATYDDLLRYLVSKDPSRIQVAELPFEGKNKVVFIPPRDFHQGRK